MFPIILVSFCFDTMKDFIVFKVAMQRLGTSNETGEFCFWFTCVGLIDICYLKTIKLQYSSESNSAAFVELSTVFTVTPDCLYLSVKGSLCLVSFFFFLL